MAEKRRHKRIKQRAFIAAFSEVGNITRACEIAEISRAQVYRWLGREKGHEVDPVFAKDFAEAEEHAADRLEQEARRRAVEGVKKPVWYQGGECGVVTEYSDTLLIFLMKGAMPEKYKERGRYEHTGKGGGPIEVKKYEELSNEEIDKILDEKITALGKAEITDPD